MTDITPPLTLGRSVWAIRPDALPRLIEAHRARTTLDALAVRAAAPMAARRAPAQRAGGAVAILPLTGVITPRASFLSMLFGGGNGLVDFRDAFREAVSSPDVGSIVLEVDSPGGLVDLVPETAAEIRAARGTKPIVAVANTMAASAAYWIASQADELVVTPSGDVGSVGVYMVHEDYSKMNDKIGVVPTYVSAGRYKVDGNPDQPLSDPARAAMQDEVNHLYAMFVNDVAAGRGVTAQQVRDGYGEGRTLLADRALTAGMVDRVATLEQVVAEQLTGTAPAGSTAARARLIRRDVERRAVIEDPNATPSDEPTPQPVLPDDADQPDLAPGPEQPATYPPDAPEPPSSDPEPDTSEADGTNSADDAGTPDDAEQDRAAAHEIAAVLI